ncbi:MULTISPECIES: IS1182 family transposase [unclassified Bradyrhizobium]|uniref:IS1182 family transposase n=1 Tax=unclassified Bradyrhizobium TaxID=2631580 RepID=UPI002479C13E|nr:MULTISPECIES: IS1182 family transposase [unclassified Bradyrhizobium]WGR69664.1 transposase [Bradyrhizobium sp. ISRA426]WGR70881.1 transposase [Bradyrhizobium sp. ISRA426]WGR72843.1 transposase [Bradyrhizobium sp. ISRA426]WGR73083.1 transposase [Bradyrhizobium sp. ISRA426]WGR73745.1 transposase [Bradyrhizobium sp. ISRA426]
MLGRKERDQLELFITGSLKQLVPDEHVLARVDRVLDLSWLREEVSDCYCANDGRPGIDPEAAVRLMLAGLLTGIVHDRKLMREAQVNIAIRWFAGYGLHEQLPHHSSLTRIRQRWGEERFRRIFKRTVEACLKAKIATAEVVHIDASLIRANVSWDSLTEQHVVDVLSENQSEDESEAERKGRQSGKYKKICTTDPDATMATNARNRRLEPAYKQHTAVDDKVGVILDVAVTTGQTNEGEMIEPQVDEVEAIAGIDIKVVTADAGYAYAKVYGALERRGIDALIPAKAEPIKSRVPLRRFRYDAKNDILKCPRGRILRPARPIKHGRFFYSKAKDCARCPLKGDCLSKGRVNKAVVVGDDYPALLRARRRRERWSKQDRRLYQRHRWRSEGFHGEAKTWHGLARAIRRGLPNMKIQAYLTAAAINLKRLAAALLALILPWIVLIVRLRLQIAP